MKVENPKISIIIPSYNPGEMILDTMNSLVNQKYKNFEVILSDDGSTDNTIELVEGYLDRLDIVFVHNQNSGGPAKPRNAGIKKARGEWIAFLDHDDSWSDNKLEEVSTYFENQDVIYHQLEIINNKRESRGIVNTRKLSGDCFTDLIVNGNAIANSGAMVKKELIERAGYIEEDKSFIAGEDLDLWIKVSRLSSKFLYIEKILGQYRLEPGQNLSESSIKIIDVHKIIYYRYKEHLNLRKQRFAEANISYTSARIFHKLNMFKEAGRAYISSLGSNILSVKLKALVGLLLLSLKLIRIKLQ
ncbi:hypothetical protein A9Q84_05200 [Halobacteriovorax marinus]|uniref:Glycosyltransferase 2-like domain-containing protein n=1 Tax=Halobacteriovorax marinus TaxID=97084 RepID=A0A1Y5FB23_9BACT|nr:hypothetical protein A9Q84_05200 [Halobacteriovorax marinus]